MQTKTKNSDYRIFEYISEKGLLNQTLSLYEQSDNTQDVIDWLIGLYPFTLGQLKYPDIKAEFISILDYLVEELEDLRNMEWYEFTNYLQENR